MKVPQGSIPVTNQPSTKQSKEGYIALGMYVRENAVPLQDLWLARKLMKMVMLSANWEVRKSHPPEEIINDCYALPFLVSLIYFLILSLHFLFTLNLLI